MSILSRTAVKLAGLIGLMVSAAASGPLPDWLPAAGATAVRWQPWGEASLATARADGRSVYVFVGSELSELSRTTFAQTFARPETAAWLNENFVCLFVDADAEPEIAAYAQHYISTVKQLRGWPAHLWLTPDLLPYDGSNYLPATEEWGRPGFLKSARTALDTWSEEPARARALGEEAIEMMRLPVPELEAEASLAGLLSRATDAWLAAEDGEHGGFGLAPKQPEPEVIRFLLTRGPEAREAAQRAALVVVEGGLHDEANGGFFRRTLDAAWREPYRQKTLVDQARIALALLAAAEAGGPVELREAGWAALDFAGRELRREDGTWAAVWDATSPESGPVLRGHASVAARALLAAAMARAGQARFEAGARELARALAAEVGAEGANPKITAHDLLGLAYAWVELGEEQAAEALRRRAQDTFFERRSGLFLASGPEPAAGVPLPVPALAEPWRAETLALLAGVDAETVADVHRALAWAVEYDARPEGEILLALAKR